MRTLKGMALRASRRSSRPSLIEERATFFVISSGEHGLRLDRVELRARQRRARSPLRSVFQSHDTGRRGVDVGHTQLDASTGDVVHVDVHGGAPLVILSVFEVRVEAVVARLDEAVLQALLLTRTNRPRDPSSLLTDIEQRRATLAQA